MKNIHHQLMRRLEQDSAKALRVQHHIDNPSFRHVPSNIIWYTLRSDVWNRVAGPIWYRASVYLEILTGKGPNYGEFKPQDNS